MNNGVFTDKRLLEAIDYIDDRFIAEVAEGYEVFHAPGEYSMTKRQKRRYNIKLAVAAACIVLLSGLVWMLPEIIQNIGVYLPGSRIEASPILSDVERESMAQLYVDNWRRDATDWKDFFDNEYYYSTLKDGIVCYLKENDVYALSIGLDFNVFPMIPHDYTVGEYTFPGYFKITIYKDNQFFSLNRAYEIGIIDDKYLECLQKEIYDNYLFKDKE